MVKHAVLRTPSRRGSQVQILPYSFQVINLSHQIVLSEKTIIEVFAEIDYHDGSITIYPNEVSKLVLNSGQTRKLYEGLKEYYNSSHEK